MKNGQKDFAPETALGTGAAEPVVDEHEAAKQVPSVDENTVGENGAQNQPGRAASIDYSGETRNAALEDMETDAGETETEPSTGEDLETRRVDDDTVAGSAVGAVLDDAEVNSKAEDVRPEVPQAPKRTRKSKDTV